LKVVAISTEKPAATRVSAAVGASWWPSSSRISAEPDAGSGNLGALEQLVDIEHGDGPGIRASGLRIEPSRR
jgi:hypothetical protein